MEELKKQNEQLKVSLDFIAEHLEYTYDIRERYSEPWLTICTGNCYKAFMTDDQRLCQFCGKIYCDECWNGSECEYCSLEYCDKCFSIANRCPEKSCNNNE